jgi:predicted Zn-dependent protease
VRVARHIGVVLAACALAAATGARAEPIARPTPIAGEVIATKGGEELQFRSEALWRPVLLQQDVVGGDTLKTNALGTVALLFEDRTQVRVGRNSTLIVKDVARGPNGETLLALPQGSMWARAARGGSGVQVDTPAAAAAIRGTDWTLSVEGAKTSLIVMEGEVTLANAQGSVTVRQGEGAEALIGQAPRKITLVKFDGREQILIYRELRQTFFNLSPTDKTHREERAARARALAVPEPARTAEQWLTLAEAGLNYDGLAKAEAALQAARGMRLDVRQRARAELVEGFVAARRQKWRQAAALFKSAQPRLDRTRQATAAYAEWVALGMADPNSRPPPPPKERYADVFTGPLSRAAIESFLDGPDKGVAIIDENIRRFPDEMMMRAGKALLYIMKGDKEAAKRAIEEARAVDPDDVYVLMASARYRYVVESDLEGALAELKRAAEIAPGASFVYGDMALVQDDRNATREAEEAHLKEIAYDPDSFSGYANYAIFLINHNRLGEAQEQLRIAERLGGGSNPLYIGARGSLRIRQGEIAEGTQDLLAASVAQPTYASGLNELATAMYAAGNLDETYQALDNADRYDDANPTTPLIRSVIAQDEYRADDAVINAREALRRKLARGGHYESIAASRDNGSFLGGALRFLELDEWARYYGDRVADAFLATAYFDQAIANRVSPFALGTQQFAPEEGGAPSLFASSSLVQGMLFDPLAIGSPQRRSALARYPFAETTAGGGLIARDGETGWFSDATIQATVMEPIPFSIFTNATLTRPDSTFANDRDDQGTATTFVGVQPTGQDNLVLFQNFVKQRQGARRFDSFYVHQPLPTGELFYTRPNGSELTYATAGAGWSHTFGERNVLQALIVGTELDQKQNRIDPVPIGGGFFYGADLRQKLHEKDLLLGVNHLLGVGDVTFQYGGERIFSRYDLRQSRTDRLTEPPSYNRLEFDGDAWRIYADATWDVSRDFKLEAGLFASKSKIDRDDHSDLGPRAGVAWQPVEGHWLRAAYRQDAYFSTAYSLSPVTTAGLTPNELPLDFGGRTKSLIGRWDAEWSPHLFTALEYQRQRVRSLSIDVPETLQNASIGKAEINRFSATANAWLTHGFGAFATYARTDSKSLGDYNDGGFTYAVNRGDPLPFLAKNFARIGLTFVHPSMVKVTVAQNFIGKRTDTVFGEHDGYRTTDVSATWESFDKHLLLSAEALNVFDKNFTLLRRLGPTTPAIKGDGRTLTASMRLRF